MITHRTLGPLGNVNEIAKGLRDLETERQQIIAVLNIMLTPAPAGEYRMVLVDEAGAPAQYKLVAGAGMTITINAGAKTVTLTSP